MSPTDRPAIPLEVVAICGSLRRGSYTRLALEVALEGAREAGARARLIDLRDYRLAFCGDEAASGDPEDVFRLRREVGGAQGIILGTPEYHGGFSGVLKNALDLIDPADLRGKMLGLVGVSGGATGSINALNGLRTIGRALHAWVVPEQASVPEAHKAFNEAGRPNDPALEWRLKNIGRQVARFAYLHALDMPQELSGAREATVPPAVEV
jgi:FMN reductase